MACNLFRSPLFRLMLLVFTSALLVVLQLSLKSPLRQRNFKHNNTQTQRNVPIKQNEASLNASNEPPLSQKTQNIFNNTAYTSNVFSKAEIINAKASYQVKDHLQIRITARDINNVPKTYGGDYFRVKLYTAETQSSWSIDVTNDLGNGTYIADVTLRWPGNVSVIVTLVHPSEAIRILQRIRDLEPGRMVFMGRYLRTLDSGIEAFEDVMCLPKVIRNQSLCNFTDGRTGYPWYCVAPSNKSLSCDDWKFYSVDPKLCEKYTMEAVSKEELEIFNIHKLPIKNSPPPLNVVGDYKTWKESIFAYQDSLPSCKPGQHLHNPAPSGFYIKNVWFSDQCQIRQFTKTDVLQCLQNRQVHIFGDSTSRQFYKEFAEKYKPEIVGKQPGDKTESLMGPMYAKGAKFNISVDFRFHGFPARPSGSLRTETIDYIINRLDDLKVDSKSVILISVGTHYTTYPLGMYEERMIDIRAAVQRLHKRSPKTLVVFKNANTRNYKKILYQLQNSEWYVRTLDLTLRAVLKDSPEVAFIDAWDMTIAQNFKPMVHPHHTVLSNLLNNFLSYVCPDASQ